MNTYKINEVRKNQFYQVPKELFHNNKYKNLSSDAKLIYALLLDRMELSRMNNWVNKEGEIYLIFKRKDIMEILQISDKTCTKAFKQLTEVKLIKEEPQGKNKPNLIYIGHIEFEEVGNIEIDELEKEKMDRENYDSGVGENTVQGSEKLRRNKTNNKKTNNILNNNQSINNFNTNDGLTDYISFFKSQIEYDALDQELQLNEKTLLDQILLIVANVFTSQPREIKISGTGRSVESIMDMYLKLTKDNILCVIKKLQSIKIQIKNIKGYIISMLYNAPMSAIQTIANKSQQDLNKSKVIWSYEGQRQYNENFWDELEKIG